MIELTYKTNKTDAKNWEIYFLKLTRDIFEDEQDNKIYSIFNLDYIRTRYEKWKELKELFELKNKIDKYDLRHINNIYDKYRVLFIINNGRLFTRKTPKEFSILDPVVCRTCKTSHICDIFNNNMFANVYYDGFCHYASLCPTCQRNTIEDMIEVLTIKDKDSKNKTDIDNE